MTFCITHFIAVLAVFFKSATSLTVTSGLSSIGVINGGFAELTFNVNPPDAQVTGYWTRIDLAGNQHRVKFDLFNFMVHPSKLEIYNFKKELAGLYVFHATDGVNHAQTDPITVYEQGSPTVSTTTPDNLVAIGQSVILECTVVPVTGRVIHDIKWLHISRNGSRTYIDESDILKYNGSVPDSPSLTIWSVEQEDIGSYWCYAEDDQSQIGMSTQIRVVSKADGFNNDSTILYSSMASTANTTVFYSTMYGSTPPIMSLYVTTEMTKTGLDSLQSPQDIISNSFMFLSVEMDASYSSMNSVMSQITSFYTTIELFDTAQDISTSQFQDISIIDTTHSGHFITGTISKPFTDLISTVTEINYDSLTNVQVTDEPNKICSCDCEYHSKLGYWATKNLTKYTMEELRVILRLDLEEIENNLRVNKKNLSSTIRKLTSATDKRPVAKQIGSVGVFLLIVIVSTIIAADIFSLKNHIQNVLMIWKIKPQK